MAFSNRWVLADGTLNDQPITIRYRSEVQVELDSGDYGQCIQISWDAEEVDPETGYPSVSELEKIDAFNIKLMEAIEPSEHGIVVMVLMAQGINQWIIYVRSNEEIQIDLNTIPTDTGLYPIDVVSEEDVSWNNFTELREAIKVQ
ncbi:MAG: hypothetical protein ACJAYK_002269 [Crocinitomicaceae bacterium]|jgi:hypothetical protein